MTTRHAPTTFAGHDALVPDLQGQLLQPLDVLIDLLGDLHLAASDQCPGRPQFALPGILAAPTTQEAIRRLTHQVSPTQCRPTDIACVYGPGQQEPHAVLTPVRMAPADVGVLCMSARVLGHPALPLAVRDLVTCYAQVGHVEEAAELRNLVATLAATAAVLSPPSHPDAGRLASQLRLARRTGGPVVLTDREEAAYQATVADINALWTASTGRHRLLR